VACCQLKSGAVADILLPGSSRRELGKEEHEVVVVILSISSIAEYGGVDGYFGEAQRQQPELSEYRACGELAYRDHRAVAVVFQVDPVERNAGGYVDVHPPYHDLVSKLTGKHIGNQPGRLCLNHRILKEEGESEWNPDQDQQQVQNEPEDYFFGTFANRFVFQMSNYILGIESSCDDTSAAVLKDTFLLSNEIANQNVHSAFGGVVPELASRAHQQNIIPVVDVALRKAKIDKNDLVAIAFTRGPGLLGSLLVGTSFAKSLAMGLGIPIIEVDHLKAHILSHFIDDEEARPHPEFPFLCLTVSGGHTQIVRVESPSQMKIIGTTLDDAAGEAFDKAAKIMGLPYPGGPVIDRLARSGNPLAFEFPEPKIAGLDYSFSGLKTSFLYFLRDRLKEDAGFIEKHKEDLCASLQKTIIDILLSKLKKASEETGIREIAIAGGVSANSGLRERLHQMAESEGWKTYVPKLQYSTDNAAMIAIAGYFKFLEGEYASQDLAPYSKSPGL